MAAQHVIALRLMKLSLGGAAASDEAHLMVAEKTRAVMMAFGMIAAAVARGTFDGGTDAVVQMLRQEVQANRKRLAPR